ncbi:hypothetical protein BWI15_11640 [Kribbella sp. ALI-6-A]|uniref:DUF2461 family protein n=1 Tax=Kribbella sp. ALI-6-A TaxID=1933817 RepID=UPI00097C86AE|nr:DUF2461 family protein [Kribbella sp. ALI-6-A]ONI74544.1 hypothetical protein BWI15_11640 [Kribbella sp. ALI-6-A]
MTDVFEGWPRSAFDVLLQLDGDPSAEVRRRCRRDREDLVRRPMIELLHAVADADPQYEDFAVWGYGEVLMQAWQRQHAIVRMARNVELSVRFDLDGLEVGVAWWYAPSEQIERYRAAVADAGSGRRLVAILRRLEREGFVISGDLLKRPLRGYPADHPRATLLRHKSVIATRPLGCEDWLHTAEAAHRVQAAFSQLRPLTQWMVKNVSLS